MSAQVTWFDQATQDAVLITFDGDWTWNDFHAAVRKSHEIVATVSHPVDLIVHHAVKQQARAPLAHFEKAMRDAPPNVRSVILIMERMRLMRVPTQFATSLEEAGELVKKKRQTSV